MKNFLKRIALILAVTLITPTLSIAYASSQNVNKENNLQKLYDEEKTEVVNIEGIQYTYKYGYENGNKVITVINNSNNTIEKVKKDKVSGDIYLNDKKISEEDKKITQGQPLFSPRAYFKWETKSSSSTYISWLAGTSVAGVAAVIATKLGSLGPKGVIAAMGVGVLGVIAAQSVGGRVYAKIQMFQAPFVNPQYRTIWGFKAGTGDYYGDYIYHW
ncbi:hypothetical protein QJR26_18085 (plasmid) [Clostridium baratii]